MTGGLEAARTEYEPIGGQAFRSSLYATFCITLALCAGRGACAAEQAASAGGRWHEIITLQDLMKRYVFPEELISYRIEFPGTFPREHLKLREGEAIKEYQLSDVEEDAQGNLRRATISFRTGLGKGQTRRFALEHDPAYRAEFPDRVVVADVDRASHTAVLRASRQQVRVPFGDFQPRTAVAAAPAPMLQIARDDGAWIGRGSMLGNLAVERVHARPIEDGNLRLVHRIEYFFAGDRRYAVELTLQHDEQHVTVDEYLDGFRPEDVVYFRFSIKDGVDPNGRLVVTNGGYNVDKAARWHYCGRFDQDLRSDGSLPYQLGIWSPHSGTCVGATAFWNDSPAARSAIIFSRYRTHQWKTSRRYIWDANDAPENLYWYAKDGDKYVQARLTGRERHWAVSVIEASQEHPLAIESQDGSKRFYWKARVDMQGLSESKRKQYGAGPEVRLYQKLTEFSLNWVKDLVLDWDEKLDAPLPEESARKATAVSYQEYVNGVGVAAKHNWMFIEHYWGRHLGGATELGRAQPKWFYDYAVSRKQWTEAERREVRAVLVHWISSVMLRDGDQAHISMLSGHPNFIIDTLFAGVYCAVFPNHPDARKWKQAFLRMYDEWLTVYMRQADPERNALGGRWVENVACYSMAALRALMHDWEGMKAYDGTDLLKDRPQVHDWLRWHMYALVTAMELQNDYPYVFTPPIGAHAREAFAGAMGPSGKRVQGYLNWEMYGLLYRYAEMLEASWPQLAAELKFCLTKGKEGTNPHLESALFRDYGAVLRYDFAGPHEAYLGVQQIGAQDYTVPGYRNYGTMNYRCSGAGNGILYYAAKGKIWSWNDFEDNGDEFNINKLPVFIVDKQGLGYHSTDGVLYNFDPVQFYRANGAGGKYRSRDVMMVRDDYLAVYDHVAEGVDGRFNWVHPIGSMPFIHAIKTGPGDNLHVAEASAIASYQAARIPCGVCLSRGTEREFLCLSDKEQAYSDSGFKFHGRTGYAREGECALFEGDLVEFDGFRIERSGGDFGLSAAASTRTIIGRVAGRRGGTVRITPPADFEPEGKDIQLNGQVISYRLDGRTFVFEVPVRINDWYKVYAILPKGTPPLPAPQHPPLTLRVP